MKRDRDGRFTADLQKIAAGCSKCAKHPQTVRVTGSALEDAQSIFDFAGSGTGRLWRAVPAEKQEEDTMPADLTRWIVAAENILEALRAYLKPGTSTANEWINLLELMEACHAGIQRSVIEVIREKAAKGGGCCHGRP